ncbi:hypothetical protein [Adhaeribacter rhizoryzae]|uniref:Uncharacterized protein n=1 Tax=Adhaeribacter rhizoryzae TaxID=2607907 RepID=A0A5M6DQD2_9BACT|nr:hypothetical protein [Adhaeribacter rhizoryzae]KAA5548439.1 hypothetical protein F0145_06855 [Adhaeribacter rhizoryzae]
MNIIQPIDKNPHLLPAQDYYFLRQQGLAYIEQLGSKYWTDYNTHDPGITILELLCYAITDIGYRIGFDIKDLLAESLQTGGQDQGFFTARQILTCHPVTVNDYRKLLIDLEGVRNAWLLCKTCACELTIYADCAAGQLVYLKNENPVIPRGLYEVMLEMQADAALGDFNNGKIKQRVSVVLGPNNQFTAMLLEVRFPAWPEIEKDYEKYYKFLLPTIQLKANGVVVTNIAKIDEPSTNLTGTLITPRALRNPLVVSLEITFLPDAAQPLAEEKILLNNVPFTVFLEGSDSRTQIAVQDFIDAFTNSTADGLIPSYHAKIKQVQALINEAKQILHEHRNLAEDYCHVTTVAVEDIAVCADVELSPDADIEKVLAQIYYQIETYFNPPLRFYSLPELQAQQVPTEEIFNGPALAHGFLKTDELEAAQLRRYIYVSDIINVLTEIEGIIAIRNLVLTKYDAQGRAIMPSQPWTLEITVQHQPRLYLEQSKILFFKNDLPFLAANPQEVWATLQQLRGAQLNQVAGPQDLPVPTGTIRDLKDYFPVQYSFPLNYGIGFEGLPEEATALRQAQAKQLKTYLFFYEQLLADFLAQLANVSQLFKLDPGVKQSYYTQFLEEQVIKGLEGTNGIYNGLSATIVAQLAETEEAGIKRRNQFLDHLLARFGEQFTDYALMLYQVKLNTSNPQLLSLEKNIGTKLLQDKILFLQDYPELSANRAKAFNYRDKPPVCSSTNIAGLQKKLLRLLGLPPDTQLFLVEHLLLRAQFYGQALLPVCLNPDCATCGEEDPYSFRVTVVLPGWLNLFQNLDYRRFAERLIRLEMPAHLLPKICWVGNEVCRGEGDTAILCQLTATLTGALTDPTKAEALALPICRFAEQILTVYNDAFRQEFVRNGFNALSDSDLELLFTVNILPLVLPDELATELNATYQDGLKATLTGYFKNKENCFQFNIFWKAWCAWLTELNNLTTPESPLAQQVESLLTAHLQLAGTTLTTAMVCACTCQILAAYGEALRTWISQEENYRTELLPADWQQQLETIYNIHIQPEPFACGFALTAAFKTDLKALLLEYYLNKLAVLQTHAALVAVLGQLKSIYPPATLHDCEDDNDDNPVRLDATIIG